MDSMDYLARHEQIPSTKAWENANRALVAKMLREFTHERLVQPQTVSSDKSCFELNLEEDAIRYRFHARLHALEHLSIRPDSISKFRDEFPETIDALQLALELRSRLGISDELFPIYLEELTSTLHARAEWFAKAPASANTLARSDYTTIEAAMIEGHPVFVANSGRIGFDADDYHRYAPEAGAHLSPLWIAVHRNKTTNAVIDGLTREQLLKRELDDNTRTRFKAVLYDQEKDPGDYCFMPVHPWQWREKISRGFAADRIQGDLVFLGQASDHYQPQQSIRTLYNVSSPQRCYVKTSLSILNMGFMRGLSPEYMGKTPTVNHWVADLIHNDTFMKEKGFRILREVAAIGYHKDCYEKGSHQHSPYRKMLSALWRESPVPLIKENQRLMTMAALLHVDTTGIPLVTELIRASDLDPKTWLRRYLDAYLSPLLHSFFAHDLVFMPHGENLILVLEEHSPVSVFMKDVGEEVAVLNSDQDLPTEVSQLSIQLDESMKINYIFLDVLDCFFRFLAPLLEEHTHFEETDFWALVAECIHAYQNRHPHLEAKFQRYDLFQPDFVRTCLNRIQLNNNRQMIDLDDREKNLRFFGRLSNPLANYREHTATHTNDSYPEKKA